MTTARLLTLPCLMILLSTSSFAQKSTAAPGDPAAASSSDAVANELSLMRKSLQTLNTRLQAITEGLLAPDAKQNEPQAERLKRISTNFDLLTRAEERAEVLRKQLIELIEKETAIKIRLTQLDEDMRPENIERAMATVGTTRTMELRDNRRRSLENEKRGLDSLVALITQSRMRLEEDVRQADQLVVKIRQRLFPMIEKEIDKLTPDR